MTDKLTIRLFEPVQAFKEITRAWGWCKPLILAGHRLTAQFGIEEDQRSIQQNRYYWGPVLGAVSKQAKLGGVGFAPEGWNWYFKRKFLGYRFKKVMIPGNKRPSVIQEMIST